MRHNARSQWHWFDYFIWFLRCIWLISAIIQFSSDHAHTDYQGPVIGWLVAAFFVPLLFFRPGRLNKGRFFAAEALMMSPLLVYFVAAGDVQALNYILLDVLLLGYLGSRRAMAVAGPLLILLIPLFNLFGHFGLSVVMMIQKMFDFILYFGMGACFHQIVRSNQMVKEKNKALEQHTKVIERLTLMEERNRLARDLHDTIGHTFISTITTLHAVKYQIKTDPDAAAQTLDELLDVTRDGLQEIRSNIHKIADDDDLRRLSERLADLADKFGVYTNTEIMFQMAGAEQSYSEAVQMTLTRFLQEALTNAKRHGSADRIEIALTIMETELQLAVKDFGTGAAKLKEGFGIRAMRERISSLRGTLRIDSLPNVGTTVMCSIPLTGE